MRPSKPSAPHTVASSTSSKSSFSSDRTPPKTLIALFRVCWVWQPAPRTIKRRRKGVFTIDSPMRRSRARARTGSRRVDLAAGGAHPASARAARLHRACRTLRSPFARDGYLPTGTNCNRRCKSATRCQPGHARHEPSNDTAGREAEAAQPAGRARSESVNRSWTDPSKSWGPHDRSHVGHMVWFWCPNSHCFILYC